MSAENDDFLFSARSEGLSSQGIDIGGGAGEPDISRMIDEFCNSIGPVSSSFSAVNSADSSSFSLSLQNNIVGVGFGPKEVGGFSTGQPAIKVFVQKKVDDDSLTANAKIPPYFSTAAMGEPIPTDIVETGIIESQQYPLWRDNGFPAPTAVPGGAGIMVQGANELGTLGAAVVATINNRKVACILTNRHVLPKLGANVTRSDRSGPALAVVTSVSPLAFSSANNRVDAALAEIDGPNLIARDLCSISVNDRIALPLKATGMDLTQNDALIGRKVFKCGRTTGYTTGFVRAINVSSPMIEYDGGLAGFRNVIAVTGNGGLPFSDRGDSGSIICDFQTRQPVGLLFAGANNGTVTYAIPIATVKDVMNISYFFGGSGALS